jgi:amino acid transporter
MWRGRVHGLWFAGAVAIAVIGVVALSSLPGGAGSGGARSDGAASWIIAVVTFAGVAYCLYRASRRVPRPPSED